MCKLHNIIIQTRKFHSETVCNNHEVERGIFQLLRFGAIKEVLYVSGFYGL